VESPSIVRSARDIAPCYDDVKNSRHQRSGRGLAALLYGKFLPADGDDLALTGFPAFRTALATNFDDPHDDHRPSRPVLTRGHKDRPLPRLRLCAIAAASRIPIQQPEFHSSSAQKHRRFNHSPRYIGVHTIFILMPPASAGVASSMRKIQTPPRIQARSSCLFGGCSTLVVHGASPQFPSDTPAFPTGLANASASSAQNLMDHHMGAGQPAAKCPGP